MPRVSRGAAVFIALVFSTAGISAVSNLSLFSPTPSVAIGCEVPVIASLSGGGDYDIRLFAGTLGGATTFDIEGVAVELPIAGIVFEAGNARLEEGSATISAAIPNDKALIGAQIIWVAVVVDRATGSVIAIARTGGPIIEDAIC